MTTAQALERRIGGLLELRNRIPPRIAVAAGALLFVASGAFAWARLGRDSLPQRWEVYALVVGIGTPVMVLLNAAEFRQAGRFVGIDMPYSSCLRWALLGAAANALPVPGSLLVRTAVLSSRGATMVRAAGANLGIAVAWAGTTLALLGVMSRGAPAGGRLAVVAVGLALIAVAAAMVRSAGVGWLRLLGQIICIELAIVVADALRYVGVLSSLGRDASLWQGLTLSAAGLAATVTGFVPGGLGLREALAGVFGVTAGLQPATAVAASALDRVGTTSMLVLLSLPVVLDWRRSEKS